MEAHFGRIQEVCAILGPDVQAYLGGSYRRGSDFSTDIDIVVCYPDMEPYGRLRNITDRLYQLYPGYIVDVIKV